MNKSKKLNEALGGVTGQRYGDVYAVRCGDVAYVGSAIGSALSRWSDHLRLLKKRTHHNARLQEAFDVLGIAALTFSILEPDVQHADLLSRERVWSERLGSVNEKPAGMVKAETKTRIAEDLRSGLKYRDIASRHGVSLGTVSNVRSQFRI